MKHRYSTRTTATEVSSSADISQLVSFTALFLLSLFRLQITQFSYQSTTRSHARGIVPELVRLQKSVDSVVAAARWMMMMLGAIQLANGFSGTRFVDMTVYDTTI